MNNMKKLSKKILIKTQLELLTGLHIGDSKESIEIGGVDSPVVRRKDNYAPYIPGSSIKGKIRYLLEIAHGENADSKAKNTGSTICKLFGAAENNKENPGIPSRLIVRDAYLTPEWDKKLLESQHTDMPYTEIKFENVIDRIRGTAKDPRQIERIPAGAHFIVNFIINIFENDDEDKLLNLFLEGLKLLEDDYLGGNGSRGYGQVKIKIINDSNDLKDIHELNLNQFKEIITHRDISFYEQNKK